MSEDGEKRFSRKGENNDTKKEKRGHPFFADKGLLKYTETPHVESYKKLSVYLNNSLAVSLEGVKS